MKWQSDSIESVHREVRSGERDGRPTQTVIAERTYAAAIDDVWNALTNPERIPRWFLPVEGDLHVGGRYQLHGNAGGEVTACEPPNRLAVTWEFDGQLSWVTVLLDEEPAGNTRLRLEHTGPLDEHWEQYGPSAAGIGWDLTILALGAHLLTGETVQLDEEELAGPEGLEAMTRSGQAWCQADIASRTPEAVARRRADNTLAAYTGQPSDPSTAQSQTGTGTTPES